MAPPGPSAESTANTPLAPSVEKAYYRKCIQLKRRLNEVEAANDEARTRRHRLDRAIMKMRLERAFLLDELRKRMEYNIDASEGSGDEGAQTPPPDRPYRDKRRRRPSGGPAPPANTFQQNTFAFAAGPSSSAGLPLVPAPGGHQVAANAIHDGSHYGYSENVAQAAAQTARRSMPLPHENAYAQPGPPTGVPSSASARSMNGLGGEETRESRPIGRGSGAIGESVGAGPTVVGDGERKALPSADPAGVEREQCGRSAFTAVNQ